MIHNSFDELGLPSQAKYQKGWWPLIAAGATLIGNYFQQQEQSRQAETRNRLDREAAQEQMKFQKDMSDTAHQREVKDLEAAGINPTMSAGGAGASSPAGSSYDPETLPTIELPDVFQAVSLLQEQERIKVQKDLAESELLSKAQGRDYVEIKKRLAKKGIIRADVESEVSDFLKQMIDSYKRNRKRKIPLRHKGHTGPSPFDDNPVYIERN